MGALLSPWTWLAAIAIAVAGFIAGVKVESDHRDAQLLVQERAMHKGYVEKVGRLRSASDAVSAELNRLFQLRKTDRARFNRELQEAKDAGKLAQVDCPQAGSAAHLQPVVRINVGVWNRALSIGLPGAGDPGRVDAPAVGTGFAPVDRAFDNLGENAERWAECRAQVRNWQDLARTNGWVQR